MSQPRDPLHLDHNLRHIEQRITQQEALVRRSIVQGAPTQGAEDRLRDLQRLFLQMTEERGRMRAGKIQRTVGPHRSK
jgi:hypothetical protein